MSSYYFTLHEHDPTAMYVYDMDVTAAEGLKDRELCVLHSIDEYRRWCGRMINEAVDSIYCSSSLDFPAEYTSVQEIVDLCNHIRGNSVELPADQPHWR